MPNVTTNTTPNTTPPPLRRKPADWRTVAIGTTTVFLAVFALLAARMQNGLDPAAQTAGSVGYARSKAPSTQYTAPADTSYLPAPAPVTRAS